LDIGIQPTTQKLLVNSHKAYAMTKMVASQAAILNIQKAAAW